MLINKALLKYGYGNFSLEILEYCEPKDLISREQYYLDLIKPEYNILKIAGSSLGYRHTEETFIKFSQRTNEHRKGITFIQSEETKAKLKEKALARTEPRTLSKEFLDTIKNNSKSIVLYNISNNTLYSEYPSILEASKSLNCSDKTIRRVLKTEKKILLRR